MTVRANDGAFEQLGSGQPARIHMLNRVFCTYVSSFAPELKACIARHLIFCVLHLSFPQL